MGEEKVKQTLLLQIIDSISELPIENQPSFLDKQRVNGPQRKRYNYVLKLAKAHEFEYVMTVLEEMMREKVEELVYGQLIQLYFLVLLSQNKLKQAKKVYEKQIKKHTNSRIESAVELYFPKSKRRVQYMGIIFSLLFLIGIVGYGGYRYYQSLKLVSTKVYTHPKSEGQGQVSTQEKPSSEQSTAQIKKVQPSNLSTEKPKNNFTEATAKTIFLQGYNAEVNQNYARASQLLSQVVNNNTIYYFTDDANFFYIKSFINQKDITNAQNEIQYFLQNKNSVYIKSDYYPYVQIEQAKIWLSQNKIQQANALLRQLMKSKNVSVRVEAKALLK